MPAKLASDRSNGLDMPFPELVGSLLWHRTVTSEGPWIASNMPWLRSEHALITCKYGC